MLLRCAAVPDDRPGNRGPWVSRQRPLFLLLLLFSSPPDGSSNILFLGRRRSGRTSSCAGEASDVAGGARPVGQLSVPCKVIPCARIWSGASVRPPVVHRHSNGLHRAFAFSAREAESISSSTAASFRHRCHLLLHVQLLSLPSRPSAEPEAALLLGLGALGRWMAPAPFRICS